MITDRKKFLANSLKIAGGISLLSRTDFAWASPPHVTPVEYTVQDIIDIIVKEVPGAPFKETVDTIKSGDTTQKVTGIVTTMFATIEVIQEAIKRNANFIIAHEPTFYNHRDDKNWVKDNTVVQQKEDLLSQHKITVWRFHDLCHSFRPDLVLSGVLKKAGWFSYYQPGKTSFEIPPQSFQELVKHIKKSLDIAHVRAIGNPDQSCKKIVVMPGAPGGMMQVSSVLKQKPDVLIAGEVTEWETVEFIRDGRLLGSPTSLIVLGHCLSEEPGMEETAKWLQERLIGVNIFHTPSKDPFVWL